MALTPENQDIFMSTQTTERYAPILGTALFRKSELLIQIMHFTQSENKKGKTNICKHTHLYTNTKTKQN